MLRELRVFKLQPIECMQYIFVGHRGVITDPKKGNKMAGAIYPEKQLAFLKQRHHI